MITTHRPPSTCPVCSSPLITLRLGCPNCATELSGHFQSCRFCRLGPADLELIEVFLRGRGNLRDVQAFLGVSYPTARARLGEVLARAGLAEPTGPPGSRRVPDDPHNQLAEVIADVATGRLSPEEGEARIAALRD